MNQSTESGRPGDQTMQDSTHEPRNAAHRLYLEAINYIADGNIEGLRGICDPDFQFTDASGDPDAPLDVMLAAIEARRRSFSNYGRHIDGLTVFVDGDHKVSIRGRNTLTQDGPFETPDGETIPATGSTVTFFDATFIRSTPAGKLLRWDAVYNMGDHAHSLVGKMQREAAKLSQPSSTGSVNR